MKSDIVNWVCVNWKLCGSTITASLLLVVLIVLAMLIGDTPSSHYLTLALLVLGACGGWLFGTLITPYPGEKGKFAAYTEALTAFVSGYVVAKVDKVVETIFTPDFLLQPLTGFRVMGFISAFIICTLITYIFRRYADA